MARLAAFYAERARGGAALIVTGGFSPNDAGNLGPHRAQMIIVGGCASGTGSSRRRCTTPAGASCCSSCTRAATASTSASSRPRRSSRRINRNAPRELTPRRDRADHRRFRARRGARARGGLRRRRGHGLGGLPDHAVPRAAHQPAHATSGAARSRTACASPPRSCATRARPPGRDFIIVYRISALDLVEGGLAGARDRAGGQGDRGRGRDHPQHRHRLARGAHPDHRAGGAARRLRLGDAAHQAGGDDPGGRLQPHQRARDRRGRSSRAATPTWCRSRAPCSPTRSSPNKARAGDRAGINICIACNQACLDHYFIGQPASCVVNPRAGRETKLIFLQGETRKRIAVVGGGPAGLSCAAVAAERGHDVTLFEKAARTRRPVQPREEDSRQAGVRRIDRLLRASACGAPASRCCSNHAASAGGPGAVRRSGRRHRHRAAQARDSRASTTRSVVGYVDVLAGRAQAGHERRHHRRRRHRLRRRALPARARAAARRWTPSAFDAHWGISADGSISAAWRRRWRNPTAPGSPCSSAPPRRSATRSAAPPAGCTAPSSRATA